MLEYSVFSIQYSVFSKAFIWIAFAYHLGTICGAFVFHLVTKGVHLVYICVPFGTHLGTIWGRWQNLR